MAGKILLLYLFSYLLPLPSILSIINGFALPLKDEHKLFLEKTLLPLHKTRYLSLYFRQLAYCVVQFVEKDAQLAPLVVNSLLKMWPKTNSIKEVLFLSELEELLELCGPEQFRLFAEAMFKQLATCINSHHFQVAERALVFWNNEHILMLMAGQLAVLLPIILPVLSAHSHTHWNKNVQILVLSALESLMELDSRMFDACVAQLAVKKEEKARSRLRQLQLWIEIDTQLNASDTQERTALYRELVKESQVKVQKQQQFPVPLQLIQSEQAQHSAPASPVRDQRRKSILPISTETFNELMTYSRSPSPTLPMEE